ncbi:hypothetical protein [Chryseobacterium tongliaoense]|uniref:hypothetical protein n=1 Tax=Chryseobacterium tongliaoense TaxID=3240933 RepID=UPI0035183219
MPVSNNNYQNQTTIIYRLDEVKKTFRQYKRKEDLKSAGKNHFLPEFLRIERITDTIPSVDLIIFYGFGMLPIGQYVRDWD